MSDSESTEKNSPRSSTLLNRPQIGPIGPRTRLSSVRTSTITSEPVEMLQNTTSPVSQLAMQSPTNPKPLPTPTTQPKPLPVPTLLSQSSPATGPIDLEAVGGHSGAVAGLPPPTPPDPPTSSKYLPSVREDEPASAPAYSDTQADSDASSQLSSSVIATPGPAKITSVVQAPPKLTPPPSINFDVSPVPWKGMPLEPALWTFNSIELQDIVSRAIRASAKESFLRFLTVENLDKVLPSELERLEAAKISTQARYRFLIHRRTMLFHALNSSFLRKNQKGDEDDLLVSKLTAQLAETIGDCDRCLEELLHINDHMAQINKLLDGHSASALAIALRKLNSSYSRRTRDLNKARERIFQLEAELEDAWKEAEKLAKELDDYEESYAVHDNTAVIERAEIVPVPRSPSQSPPPHLTPLERRNSTPMPMTPTLLSVKNVSALLPTPTITLAHPMSASITTPLSEFVFPLPVSKTEVNDDAISVKSSKSVRSTKSSKSAKGHSSLIQAARIRSSRTSQSSLRLSTSSSHGKGPCTNTSFDDMPPPMPEIPIQFMSAVYGASAKGTKNPFPDSFGQLDAQGPKHRRPASLSSLPVQGQAGVLQRQDSSGTFTSWRRSEAAVESYKGKSIDDIYVGARRKRRNISAGTPKSPYSKENAPSALNWDDDDEIRVVQRSPRRSKARAPVHPSTEPSDDDSPPAPPPKDPSRSIPSIWQNPEPTRQTKQPLPLTLSSADLPAVPESDTISQYDDAQKSVSGSLSGKAGLLKRSKTLHKIKGLTKRYSAAIPPLFNGKTSSGRPA